MYLARDEATGAGFTEAELTKSQTASREGITNIPNSLERIALVKTCVNILMPPRLHYGIPISPSSGFRCLELERCICRKKIARILREKGQAAVQAYLNKKQHPKGQAVDFEIPGIPNIELAKWMIANTDFDQLILEYYKFGDPSSGWLHGSFVGPGQNRKMVLTISDRGPFEGLPED